MFAGSRFCPHCGVETSRELLAETAPLKCPRCRQDMQALLLGGRSAHECPSCGGQWLEPEHLQALALANESRAVVIGVLAGRVPSTTSAPDVVRYVRCPVCDRVMNRKAFATSSSIVLDVCVNHGLWLDRGELDRVLRFVETGGMARARLLERERFDEEQRRLAALARIRRDEGSNDS